MGVYSDEKAKAEAQKAELAKAAGKQAKKKKAVGSQFFNDLAGILGDEFMKRGATLHGCDIKTRDAFANMDIAGYNYGIYRYKHDLKKYPDRLILGSETFCKDAYRFREFAKENPRIIGDFVWAGKDYLGEVGVGSWEYSDYAPKDHVKGWVSAGSGRIDLIGNPLGEALYTRVALEKEKGPLMAVCPVNHTGDKHSPSSWKMSNALPTWNWRGCEGKTAKVEVYARAALVELKLNEKSVAKKSPKNDCIVRFSLPWSSGILEAVSYDENGKVIGTCRLESTGKQTILIAEPEKLQVKPEEVCFIRLRYTDENKVVLPLERNILTVTINGGELLGLGNACPYNEIGYVTNRTDTYYGEALAAVRAGNQGRIELTVADGKLIDTAFIQIV
jgi:beta-galactosidase